MVGRRAYGEGCASAHALDLVGERWGLLVVRELLLGPKRFTDLRRGMPGASPNVLAQRLRELEEAGILRRRKLAPPAAAWVYELTAWGQELEPVVLELGRWGARSPSMQHEAPLSVDALMLALKTLFDPGRAADLRADLVVRLGEDTFRIIVFADRIEIARGELESPDAVIETDPDTLNAVIFAGRTVADALAAGELAVSGDRALIERFVGLFPLPEPATAPSTPTTAAR